MKHTMECVTAIINFIRSTSSLQHRLFRQLLADMSADHTHLLLHNNLRWLSLANSLKRVCDLKSEIITFLGECKSKKADAFLSQMLDVNFVADMCFLCDIFHHLNSLNLSLQGRDRTVIDTVEKITAFQRKLDLFTLDLNGRLSHFPTL